MKEIVIPKKLLPLVEAFSAGDYSARLLINEVAKIIGKTGKSKDFDFDEKEISNEEIEGTIALMKGIFPHDTLEMIYAAQIVSSHLMGLRLLSYDFRTDQILGLKLLRFSNDVIGLMQKKRIGERQNINFTFDHAGSGTCDYAKYNTDG